ncbi:MAG: hypothetical protein JG781_476 [Peptococcaceae bacterium]|nr:hypothetical protein [Peptococcaceae bacterium]
MLFFCLLSLLMGIFFNEEVLLYRLSKNLSYPHEGWLLVKHDKGVFFFVFVIFAAIFKSWLWCSVLITSCGAWWLIPAGIFIMANFLVVSLVKGLYYSAWLSFLGMTIAHNALCFQGSFTMAIVFFLFTRNFTWSVHIWRVSLGLVTLALVPWPQGLYWSTLLVLCYLFSKKRSPFILNLIR